MQRYIVGGKDNTKFIHDGDDVLVDDNPGTLTKYLNGEGIDNKLRVQQGSSISYFLSDHLGSTNGLADASGSITSQTVYDSFGNQKGAIATRYGHTGRERDDFSGLIYYRARFYDANLGRFTSEDPIGFSGGDLNLYGYVWNNPLAFSDPHGLNPFIRLGRKVMKKGKPYIYDTYKDLTMKQAQNVRRNEGEIFTNDPRTAKQIEGGAFPDEKPLRHDAHGDNAMFNPHYQTSGKGGHTFIKSSAIFVAPNTMGLSDYACTTNIQFGSAIFWDFAGLADPTGLTDSIDAYTGLDGGRGGFPGLGDLALDTAALTSPVPLPYEYFKLLY